MAAHFSIQGELPVSGDDPTSQQRNNAIFRRQTLRARED